MPTQLSPDDFRRLAHRAVDLVADHMSNLTSRPVRRPVPREVRARLERRPGSVERDPDEILDQIGSDVLAYPMGNAHPSFYAWINSDPAPISVIGELIAAGLDASVAGGDHAATYLEHGVLSWMRGLVGYPEDAGGLLTSGGSVANLTGLGAMRHSVTSGAVRSSGMVGAPPMVVYTSDQAHSSIQKALEILGFGSDNLRIIRTDDELRLDVDALERAINRDRSNGLRPVAVAASAGTVNSGAVDLLGRLADVCADQGLWLHVDGSYGAFGLLDDRLTHLFRGIEGADSIALDPHKWLGMPVECGCALVKDRELLRSTFSLVPEYLRDDAEMPWFSEFGVQQTRSFRALKLWMALETVGESGFAAQIRHHNDLAQHLAELVRAEPRLELVAHGPLSIVCFRYRSEDPDRADEINRRVATTIQAEGRAFLTSTVLDSRVALRACIVNRLTEEEHLADLVTTVCETGMRVDEVVE